MLDGFLEWFKGLAAQVVSVPVYWAAPLMIVVGALDSSLLSLPEINDYITVARIANHPSEVYYFPLFPAIGSVIGCLVLYRIARRGEQFVAKRFHPKHLERVQAIYRKWGALALVLPSLLPPPMPFKIFVAAAGVMNYPPTRFAITIMIARTVRYYFWGILAFFFRDEVKKMVNWMEAHFLAMLVATLALTLLFVLIKWAITKFKSSGPPQTSFID